MMNNTMKTIDEQTYKSYLAQLIKGNKQYCKKVVEEHIEQKIDIKTIYINLFQRSLYDIGSLWEQNKISVAVEHLSTSITHNLMNIIYPILFSEEKNGKKAIIANVADEYHQIGSKMVADFFEFNKWDGYYLGASTPEKDLIKMIDDIKPHVVGLSVAIYFNIPKLIDTILLIHKYFKYLPIIVGGQAFSHNGVSAISERDVEYIPDLYVLEKYLSNFE